MERFQEYLVSIDPLHRLRKTFNYGQIYTKDFLAKIKKGRGIIFVAEDGGKIVAFIGGIISQQITLDLIGQKPIQSGRILELFVEQDYRGSGIGKQLMEEMERYLKKNGCKYVFVEVFGPNESAHEFYKRLGYTDRDYDMQKQL